jgi:hypothetical protein
MFFLACCFSPVVAADEVPKTVSQLFDDFDPRNDALDAKIKREWE